MRSKKRIVMIGTGGRSLAYCDRLRLAKGVEIVACADTSAASRKRFVGMSNLIGKMQESEDCRRMMESVPQIDGVTITTPNCGHADSAMESMERGCVVALENPIAKNARNCQRILDTC